MGALIAHLKILNNFVAPKMESVAPNLMHRYGFVT